MQQYITCTVRELARGVSCSGACGAGWGSPRPRCAPGTWVAAASLAPGCPSAGKAANSAFGYSLRLKLVTAWRRASALMSFGLQIVSSSSTLKFELKQNCHQLRCPFRLMGRPYA